MSERKSIFVDFQGLVTSPGTLARPKGSFSSLQNFTVDNTGVIRKREGLYSSCVGGSGGTNYVASQYVHKATPGNTSRRVILSTGTSQAEGAAFSAYTVTQSPTGLGTLLSPTKEPSSLVTTMSNFRESTTLNFRGKMQTAMLGNSVYITAQNTKGQLRLDVDGTSLYTRPAGIPKGLGFAREHYNSGAVDVGCQLNAAPTGGVAWLADGSGVAYRCVISVVWDDQTEKLGAPSGRFVIYNRTGETGYSAAAATAPVLKIMLPWATATGTLPIATTTSRVKILLYRTNAAASGTVPDEEYFLCYEGWLTVAELAAPYITITDTLSQSLLGEALYTNGSQTGATADFGVGGLINANEIPPEAVCLESWDNRIWYGQTKTVERLECQLVDQLVATDTITVNGTIYTARAVGALTITTDFSIGPYVATLDALEYQANSLVTAINRNSANTSIYAYYIGTGTGLVGGSTAPGRILLEKRTFPTSITGGFQVSVGQPTKWSPFFTAGLAIKGKSRWGYMDVWFSKDGNGDAVPFTNLLALGSDQSTLLAMKALEEGVYVFTTAGLFLITGRGGAYSAQLLDPTCIPLGRELVCVCEQTIYAWTMLGVCAIRGGRIEYISEPIRDKLLKEYVTYYGVSSGSLALDRLKAYSFMSADSIRHRVYLWLPYDGTWDESKYATRAYVFNTATGKWTYMETGTNGSKANSDVSSGMELTGTGKSGFSEWNSDQSAMLFTQLGTEDTHYSDYYGTSSTARAFNCTLTLNFEAPEFESKVFWDELHILWEYNQTFTQIDPPAAISLNFAADFTDAVGAITVSPASGNRYTRVKIPASIRHSARISVTLQRQQTAEGFGIEGLVLFYSGGSKETVRT